MHRFLIFRTDRIGDFIFSRIITDSIKKKNSKNIIDFVCSSYNAKYAKNYKDINKIYILDKYNLKLMIKNLININTLKYDYIIILDGKRRSVFFSCLLRAKYKIAILKDWRPFFLLRIFFNNYLINSETNSQFRNFITLANLLDLKVDNKINYYDNYVFKKKKIINVKKDYILLHLDEKWFKGFYHNDFNYMNLDINNFDLFVNTIFNKFKMKILITSGKINVPVFREIINKHFKKINKNIFHSIKYKDKLQYVDNSEFQDLELLVKKSKFLICCEGAISHVSHAFKIKTIALVNYIGIKTGIFWTNHMSGVNLIYRDNIEEICKKIKKLKVNI